MITNSYAKNCKEVFEILKLTPKKQLELIPNEVLMHLEQEAQKYDENFNLEFDIMGEPKISHEAQVMILSIYRKYFMQEEQRDNLNSKLRKNDSNLELKKYKHYSNSEDIFYKSQIQENAELQIEVKNKSNQAKNQDFSNKLVLISKKNKFFSIIQHIFEKIKNWK